MKKKKRSKEDRVVDKFLAYLMEQAELYGSYEQAIEMMIYREKDPLNIKQLNKLKEQYKGR